MAANSMFEDEAEMYLGIYKSYDALKNLKIKVLLRKAAPSFMSLEESSFSGICDNTLESGPLASWKRDEIEECIFGWQEKVFSFAEAELYSNKDNCVTFLENTYHQKILEKRSKEEKLGSVLFSYVDADISSENFKHKVVSSPEKPNYLSKQISELRKRHSASNNSGKDGCSPVEGSFWCHKKKVNVIENLGQTMYIMAALSSSLSGDKEEFILCTIHAGTNGTIYVNPDFNQKRSPYTIELSKKDVYQYIICHASNSISKHDAEREKTLMKKLYSRNRESIMTAVGNEFDMASDMMLRIHVFGEIVSAKDFECDNLYIHYFLKLPQYWTAPDTSIEGVTQTCKTKVEDENEVAYFCYPFDLLLTYQEKQAADKDAVCLSPDIFVEVVSVDFWGHQHIEGYGYNSLPITPGSHFISLNTWTPLGQSCINKLRHFFIGGFPELEDPMYAGIPSTFQDKQFNKLGIQIQSSGTVCMRFHVVHQSQSLIQAVMENKGNIFDHLMSSSMQNSIAAVLSAFQRARQRMLAVREMLDVHKE